MPIDRPHYHVRLQFSQVRQKRRAFLESGPPVEMDAIGGRHRRHHTRRRVCFDPLEEGHVVVYDVLERVCAVVVKVRSGLADAAKPGDVELVPVVVRRRASDEAGQQRAARIRRNQKTGDGNGS